MDEPKNDNMINECAVPLFNIPSSLELPECQNSDLSEVVMEHKNLFRTAPAITTAAQLYISTTGNPVKIPPRRIPGHYRDEVENQIKAMLENGIIKESSI